MDAMADNGVRVVCFDWGGVILRIARTWDEACETAGVEARPRDEATSAVCRALASEFQIGRMTATDFYERFSSATGATYTPDEVRRAHDAWLIAEYPGIDGLLSDLAGRGDVSTGLLSNTNAAHWARHLPGPDGRPADFPAISLLDHRVGSHLICAAKPTEAAFAAFEAAAGVKPRDVLYFDDLKENVEAARRRGWRTEIVDHTGDTASQIGEHLRRYGVL